MDESELKKAMQLISYAGTSRSQSVDAINTAEKGDIEAARVKLNEAKKSLHEAHQIQTDWMTSEMNGKNVEKSILLIHSQDHFMGADVMLTMAEKVINLNEKLESVKC